MASIQIPQEQSFIPHTPSPKQRQFLALRCREALYGGKAGCGKSDALLMAASQGVMIPQYNSIIFRRSYAELSKPGALMDRAATWWRGKGPRWVDEQKAWLFPSGATVGFGYLESDSDLNRYQGPEYQCICFDEQTQLVPKRITYLHSRLRRTKDFPENFPLRVRGATNPGGLSHKWHVKRYAIKEGVEFPENSPPVVVRDETGRIARVFVPAHPKDNPGLDWEDYALSLAELDPITRMQLERGIWIQDSSGLVYSSYPSTVYVDALPEHGGDWEYILAIDIGATGNSAVAIYAICPWLPEVYLLLTDEPEGCDTPSGLAAHLNKLNEEYHFVAFIGDYGGLGKGYLQEFRDFWGLPFVNAQKADKPGNIMLFNGALATGMLRVVRGATNTWQEQASSLLWKDDRHIEEMAGMPNHSCDAALYGYRECKHYTCGRAPVKRDMDQVEQAEQDAAELELDSLERDGMVIPSIWR